MDEIKLLGLKINRVKLADVLSVIEDRIRSKAVTHVVTADASMVVIAKDDPELLDIVNTAELVTPDGAGIIWASRLLGTPVPERVSGVDLVKQLCRLSSDPAKGYRIFFLGAAPDVAAQAAKNLTETYPGCNIIGTQDGYFKPDKEEEIVNKITALNPDIVFVGFGIPKQEKFIRKNRDIIGASIYIGIGGSFDVYSGMVKRAPVWMQNAGLEWIFRLAQNPKKISKVMTLPKFVSLALKAKFLQ